MKNVIVAISFVFNLIFGMLLIWNWSDHIETRREAQVVVDKNVDLSEMLLDATELTKYGVCGEVVGMSGYTNQYNPVDCLEIVWNKYSELKKKTSPVDKEDSALTTCRTDLNGAKKEIKKLESDLNVAKQNVAAKEKEIKAFKENGSTKVAKTDSKKKPKEKFQNPDSPKSGDYVVTSGDCLQTCNDMVVAAVDPLEKTIAGLKTELTTAQELNKNYKQVIETLEDDVKNKARIIQELEKENSRLIRELDDDGFSGGDASIRGVPSHTNNIGCALSWSTAQPHAPPGV